MDLKEAKDVKKMMQEYTEELLKKYLNDPDNHDDVITHLYPDILECEVKWASGSIAVNKTSGGDRIPVELFQILKSVALNMPANLENSPMATGLVKVSFHSNPKERTIQEYSNYHTNVLISHASKMHSKSFNLGISSM